MQIEIPLQLVLNEDQEMIARTAREFMDDKSPVSRFRALRDSGDAPAFSKDLWKEMAELGWVGIAIPEAFGGAGLGMAEMCLILEAAGRNLAPEPLVSSVLLGGGALLVAGSEEQKRAWLPDLVEGRRLLALAFQETGARYDPAAVKTRVTPTAEGFQMRGEKIQVLDGDAADAFVVSARHCETSEIGLYLVPRDAPGLGVTRQRRVDSRGAALLRFEDVGMPAASQLSAIAGVDALDRVLDIATVGLCAEMLGGMQCAFDLALAHLKEREQFGVKIGSFQALQHRAARLFVQIELCRSSVMAAARAHDASVPERAELTSLAKARCSETYVEVTNEAVQFFGGVGMTDEYDIGFYMKRARAAESSFGDAAHHRDRWARLRGY